MKLIDIVRWLMPIESEAEKLYRRAATVFAKEKQLAEFLKHIARDEAWHFQVMQQAAVFLEGKEKQTDRQTEALFVPDFTTVESLEAILLKIRGGCDHGSLTAESMVECIIDLEFSEWNDFFLHVISFLKDKDRIFQAAAAGLHHHILEIGQFIENNPRYAGQLDKLKRLPAIWRERVLVVDDFEPVVDLLKTVLSRDYLVDTAENGQEALGKLMNSYYDLIVSDIDMPVMNGIELYDRATAADRDIGRRFLFYSGGLEPQVELFLRDNNLPYLTKPASIRALQEAAADIIRKAFDK